MKPQPSDPQTDGTRTLCRAARCSEWRLAQLVPWLPRHDLVPAPQVPFYIGPEIRGLVPNKGPELNVGTTFAE